MLEIIGTVVVTTAVVKLWGKRSDIKQGFKNFKNKVQSASAITYLKEIKETEQKELAELENLRFSFDSLGIDARIDEGSAALEKAIKALKAKKLSKSSVMVTPYTAVRKDSLTK